MKILCSFFMKFSVIYRFYQIVGKPMHIFYKLNLLCNYVEKTASTKDLRISKFRIQLSESNCRGNVKLIGHMTISVRTLKEIYYG